MGLFAFYTACPTHGAYVVAVAEGGAIQQTSDSGMNWFSRTSGVNTDLNAVECIRGKCWTVGDAGVILHSADAGVTWSPQASGTTENLYDVDFLSTRLGWAVGGKARVLATTDGGMTWNRVYVGSTTTFLGLDFVDDLHGWIVGDSATIRHTADGGQNWSYQTSGGTLGQIWDVDFVDNNIGYYIYGGQFGKTVNGGGIWTLTDPPEFPNYNANDIQFLDSQIGFVVTNKSGLFVTEDGGVSWKNVAPVGDQHFLSIFMLDRNVGWAGANTDIVSDPRMWMTIDGGIHWSRQTIGLTSQDILSISAFVLPTAGDYNSDGLVDERDYELWKSTFGSLSDPSADGNDNGIVDAADYVIWRDRSATFAGGINKQSSVPEPNSLLLLLLTVATFIGPYRR